MKTMHTSKEKSRMVLEVLRGESTLNEVAARNNVHPTLLSRWKTQAIENMPESFERTNNTRQKAQEIEKERDELYKQIGKLTTQIEWLKKNLDYNFNRSERINMLELERRDIPLSTQAELLGLNRTSLYYKPKPTSDNDIKIKAAIDRLYTEHPELGYRRISKYLKKYEGIAVNHKSVYRHMREMGIQAIYPRPNTSKPSPANKIYPYLLNGLDIIKPNQVWSIDITYIPIRKSWLYLVAILDWYSRYVVEWEIDDNLEIEFVLKTCRNALTRETPEIMNSDQGSHFTSPMYTKLFLGAGSRISMDHRGRAFDNIFIERLWRTVKYENVYINQYDTPKEARIGLKRYLNYYNEERLHQSLGYKTPLEVYRE